MVSHIYLFLYYNDNNNDNNNDNSIKDTNELKFNISVFQENQTFYKFYKDIIIKEPPFISPDSYLMTHQESLRRLWEGNNRIFNDVSELRNRTGVIYVDLYNYLTCRSRHKNKKKKKKKSEDLILMIWPKK